MKNKKSITEIIREHEASLIRYASRLLNDSEMARDVVQKAFISFLGKKDSEIKNPGAFLFVLTRNLSFDHMRSMKRKMKISLGENKKIANFADSADSPGKQTEKNELMNIARQEINKLKSEHKEVLILKLEQDKSYKQIAEIMNLSVSNVGFIIHNSIKKLKKNMAGKI